MYSQIPINLLFQFRKNKINFKQNPRSKYKLKIHGAICYKKIYLTKDLIKGTSSQTNLKSIKAIAEVETLSVIKFAEIKPK